MNSFLKKLQASISALKQGNLQLSEQLILDVIANTPANADSLHILALIRQKQNNTVEAKQLYIKSLKLAANNLSILFNYGNFLLSIGDTSAAIAVYEKLNNLKANNPSVLYNLALAFNRQQEYPKAIVIIEQAIKLDNKQIAFHLCLGNSYKGLNKFKQSIDIYNIVLNMDPKNVVAIHNKGVSFRLLGKAQEAIDCYKQILHLNTPELYFNLGCAYYDLLDFKLAEQYLNKAIAIAPEYVDAHEALNKLIWETGNTQQFNQSYLSYFKSTNKPSEHMHYSMISQLMTSKNLELASEESQKALKIHGQLPQFQHALAAIYCQQNDKQELAKELFTKALTQRPDNIRYRIDIANVLIQESNYKAALNHLESAIKIAPDNQEIWAFIGTCWRLLNDERHQWLNNYDTLVQIREIEAPNNYDNLEHFMSVVSTTLQSLHNNNQRPLDQSVMGGTQTNGELFQIKHPVIQQLKVAIETQTQHYLSSLTFDQNHPFLKNINKSFSIEGSWSVLLKDKGLHTNHIHPLGWLSSPTYIDLPSSIHANDKQKEGWIKFGETSLGLGDRENIAKEVCPEVGKVVFFPSYIWHGTHPFNSPSHRLTTACDIQVT